MVAPGGDVAVIIPARNEADRIAATVQGAASIPGVGIVLVVDDGSRDGTAGIARAAGARVVRHPRSRGKAAAMETGAEAVRLIESRESGPGHPGPLHLLFLDADLEQTAAGASPLVQPVRSGEADMTIAVFRDRVRQGGHGLVVGLSGAGIQQATGWKPAQPLNGQRCLTRIAFESARPLAARFGAETGLTIDLLRQGMRVTEVEVPLAHRATGRDWRSQLHRARQLADVTQALAARSPSARSAVATTALAAVLVAAAGLGSRRRRGGA
jgi:hypothetical protein